MTSNVIQKRARKAWLFAAVVLAAGIRAKAAAPDAPANPYSPISQRNIFDLRAPVVPKVETPKPPVLPKITLTGITTILGVKIAFITIKGIRAGEHTDSIALMEGQAENDVEIKQIDDRAGIVKVINHGQPQTLDFSATVRKPSRFDIFRN